MKFVDDDDDDEVKCNWLNGETAFSVTGPSFGNCCEIPMIDSLYKNLLHNVSNLTTEI